MQSVPFLVIRVLICSISSKEPDRESKPPRFINDSIAERDSLLGTVLLIQCCSLILL